MVSPDRLLLRYSALVRSGKAFRRVERAEGRLGGIEQRRRMHLEVDLHRRCMSISFRTRDQFFHCLYASPGALAHRSLVPLGIALFLLIRIAHVALPLTERRSQGTRQISSSASSGSRLIVYHRRRGNGSCATAESCSTCTCGNRCSRRRRRRVGLSDVKEDNVSESSRVERNKIKPTLRKFPTPLP